MNESVLDAVQSTPKTTPCRRRFDRASKLVTEKRSLTDRTTFYDVIQSRDHGVLTR